MLSAIDFEEGKKLLWSDVTKAFDIIDRYAQALKEPQFTEIHLYLFEKFEKVRIEAINKTIQYHYYVIEYTPNADKKKRAQYDLAEAQLTLRLLEKNSDLYNKHNEIALQRAIEDIWAPFFTALPSFAITHQERKEAYECAREHVLKLCPANETLKKMIATAQYHHFLSPEEQQQAGEQLFRKIQEDLHRIREELGLNYKPSQTNTASVAIAPENDQPLTETTADTTHTQIQKDNPKKSEKLSEALKLTNEGHLIHNQIAKLSQARRRINQEKDSTLPQSINDYFNNTQGPFFETMDMFTKKANAKYQAAEDCLKKLSSKEKKLYTRELTIFSNLLAIKLGQEKTTAHKDALMKTLKLSLSDPDFSQQHYIAITTLAENYQDTECEAEAIQCFEALLTFPESLSTPENNAIIYKELVNLYLILYMREKNNRTMALYNSRIQQYEQCIPPAESTINTGKTITQKCARVLAETPELLEQVMKTSFLWQEMLNTIRQEGADEAFLTMLRHNNLSAAADFITASNDDIQHTLAAGKYSALTPDNIPLLKSQLQQDPYNRLIAYQLAHCYLVTHTKESLLEAIKYHAIAGNTDHDLTHQITVAQNEHIFSQLKNAITAHRVFMDSSKTLRDLLLTFTPTEPLIPVFETSQATNAAFNTAKKLFETLQTHCLTILDAQESSDLAYLTAYQTLYLAQHWIENTGITALPEFENLKDYAGRTQSIKNTNQDLLAYFESFESEKKTLEQTITAQTIQDAPIKDYDNFIKKIDLTYQNCATVLGKNAIETHEMLAHLLQSELSKIMDALESYFNHNSKLKPLLIGLWQVCRSHYEMANIFSESWAITTYTLAKLYQETEQLAYAKKTYREILEHDPDNALAKEGLGSLNDQASEKNDDSAILEDAIYLSTAPISETLQTALNLAAEADAQRDILYQLCTYTNQLMSFNPDNSIIKHHVLALAQQVHEKYQAAKNMLARITPPEHKKLKAELAVFSLYLDIKMTSTTCLSDSLKANDDDTAYFFTHILAIAENLQAYFKPFQHPVFRQYQYLALLDFAEAKRQSSKTLLEEDWQAIEKIYQKLWQFPEVEKIQLTDALADINLTLFDITKDKQYKTLAIHYSNCTVDHCINSQKEHARDNLDTYIQRVSELTRKTPPNHEHVTLPDFIRKIIQSPDFLALLLENGFIWQNLLSQLRTEPYDANLIALFKKYHLDDALAFLVKTDDEIREEIKDIPVIYSPYFPLTLIKPHIDILQKQLKAQPYSISIIYQLAHDYLQERMILTKPGSQASAEAIINNKENITQLHEILWKAAPDLFCRITIELCNETFSQWQTTIKQKNASEQTANQLNRLIDALNPPLTAPLTQETLNTFAQNNKHTAAQYQEKQINCWRTMKILFNDCLESIPQSDDITQRRLYHIMALCYKQGLQSTPNDSAKEKINADLIESLEKIHLINERLKTQVPFSDETRYHLNLIDIDGTMELAATGHWESAITYYNNLCEEHADNLTLLTILQAQRAECYKNAGYALLEQDKRTEGLYLLQETLNISEQYRAEISDILVNHELLASTLANKTAEFDEEDVHFIAFKEGIEALLRVDHISALSSFLEIIKAIDLKTETSTKHCQLYHDAYFIIADVTRRILMHLSTSIQPKTTENLIHMGLWRECKKYYDTILKQDPPSPHHNEAQSHLPDVYYGFGQAFQRNAQWSLAKMTYETALKYDEHHAPSRAALAIVAPLVEAPKTVNTAKETLLTKNSAIQNGHKKPPKETNNTNTVTPLTQKK